MTTATDIITYIGIPLAVLGVLPILYTFGLSILTQRRIRNLLIAHGHRPHTTTQEGFMLRAGPMTSLIEVEMPRYTIAPMQRDTERYWEVDAPIGGSGVSERKGLLGQDGHGGGHMVERVESTLSMVEEGRVRGFLRGGSWRTFHWRRLVVGRKLYRIQYEDELREPPAEIDFADLVNFLMDWGAELDEMGWEKLRSGGLWTPAGTVLLKVSDDGNSETDVKAPSTGHGDWVLRTSMPDDSDGILTLCVRWPSGRAYGSERDVTSLPPGWARLRKPELVDQDGASDDEKKDLLSAIAQLTKSDTNLIDTTSFRFKLESGSISNLHTESYNKETGTTLSLFRSTKFTHGPAWFTSATSAVLTLTKDNGSLWGFEPPLEIQSFIRKDSLPCGVLVLLGLLDAEQAPHWDSDTDTRDDNRSMATAHHKRYQARLHAERLEATMPAEQAQVHRRNREVEALRAQTEEVMTNLAARRARELKRTQAALVSPRMSGPVVAKTCLAWLVERGNVAPDSTVVDVAAAVLYWLVLRAQVQDASPPTDAVPADHESLAVLMVLEEWTGWAVAGGMKKEHFDMLDRYKLEFCYAACLVAVVQEAAVVSPGKGRASVDMLECLRMWRKVRLG